MYPRSYIQYLVHFHGDRDYFECHEIMEDYWKETDTGNKASIWVAFILLAVSNYHYRRGNLKGALRTLEKSASIFRAEKSGGNDTGLDYAALIESLEKRLKDIQLANPYTSFNLPIHDHALLRECQETAKKLDMEWGLDSDLSNSELVHRHYLRDRTGVITERLEALAKKNRRQ